MDIHVDKTYSKYETKILCEEIKRKYSIIDYVKSKGIIVHERGDRNFIVCPFHMDNDPSLNIEKRGDVEVFYCFGCKKTGTIIDFFSLYEKIGIGETIKILGKGIEFNFDIMDLLDEFDEKEKKVDLGELNTAISIHCFEYLCQIRDRYSPDDLALEFNRVDLLYSKIDKFLLEENIEKIQSYYDEICLGNFFTERLKQLENMDEI